MLFFRKLQRTAHALLLRRSKLRMPGEIMAPLGLAFSARLILLCTLTDERFGGRFKTLFTRQYIPPGFIRTATCSPLFSSILFSHVARTESLKSINDELDVEHYIRARKRIFRQDSGRFKGRSAFCLTLWHWLYSNWLYFEIEMDQNC